MARRYHDPIAQVVIEEKGSGYEWHWGSPQYPFLTSVSFAMDRGAISAFSIGIDVPYDYAMKIMDKNKTPFKQGNVVKARIGYASGGWTAWAVGFLMNGGKGISMTPDGASGNLEIAWTSTKATRYTVSQGVLVGAGMDSGKIIENIAVALGLEHQISSGAREKFERWERARGKLGPSLRQIDSNSEFFSGLKGKDNLEILKLLVERNSCSWWIGNNGGPFGARTLFVYTDDELSRGVYVREEARPFKYVIRGILDEANFQFPCYSFEPESDATSWIDNSPSGEGGSTKAVGVDTMSGDIEVEEMLAINLDDSMYGVLEADKPDDVVYDGLVEDISNDGAPGSYMSVPMEPNGIAVLKEQANQFMRQGDPALRGVISTIGVPEESIGSLCELWGAGAIFNSIFQVETITHSWQPGSWDMQLGVYRKGTVARDGDQKETAGGQVSQ